MMQAWADYLQGLKVSQERRPAVAPPQGVEPSNDSLRHEAHGATAPLTWMPNEQAQDHLLTICV